MLTPTPLNILKEERSHKQKEKFHVWLPGKPWVYITGPTNLLIVILRICPRTFPTDSSNEGCSFRPMLIKDDSKEETILILLLLTAVQLCRNAILIFPQSNLLWVLPWHFSSSLNATDLYTHIQTKADLRLWSMTFCNQIYNVKVFHAFKDHNHPKITKIVLFSWLADLPHIHTITTLIIIAVGNNSLPQEQMS